MAQIWNFRGPSGTQIWKLARMTTAIFYQWKVSSNSTVFRFAAKGISKNIIIRTILGPKINIEKSQMGPHKGPLMEFGKKIVIVQGSLEEGPLVVWVSSKSTDFYFFTPYIGKDGSNLKLQGPLWDPNMRTGTNDHRHFSPMGWDFHFHIMSLRGKNHFKKYQYQTWFWAKNKYRKITKRAPFGPHKMEFRKNIDGSGVPIGRSLSSMSFI